LDKHGNKAQQQLFFPALDLVDIGTEGLSRHSRTLFNSKASSPDQPCNRGTIEVRRLSSDLVFCAAAVSTNSKGSRGNASHQPVAGKIEVFQSQCTPMQAAPLEWKVLPVQMLLHEQRSLTASLWMLAPPDGRLSPGGTECPPP
jgi:hypothetical protein